MKHVGFMGGSSFVEMGTVDEMLAFFEKLHTAVTSSKKIVLVEKLFRRYLPIEDLDDMLNLIKKIKNDGSVNNDESFLEYLSAIEACIESSQVFHKSWGIYQPLKTVITDMPFFIDEKRRALEKYDALSESDLPFWLR